MSKILIEGGGKAAKADEAAGAEGRGGCECTAHSGDVQAHLQPSVGFIRTAVQDEGVKASWSPSRRH